MILKQFENRLIFYARVGTSDQELSLQVDWVLQHGVKNKSICFLT